jgi:hypothetical protein
MTVFDGRHDLPVERIDPAADLPDRPSPTLVFLHEGLGSIAQWRDFPLAVSPATQLPAVVYERWGH